MENADFLLIFEEMQDSGLNQKSIFLTNHLIKHFAEWCDMNSKRLDTFSEDDIYDYLEGSVAKIILLPF